MQRVDLQVLEQDPAVAVHDRLWQAGRSRAEEHVQRVVEGDRLEDELSGLGSQLLPWHDTRDCRAIGQVGDHHRGPEAWQRRADGSHLLRPIHVLAGVSVAVDG